MNNEKTVVAIISGGLDSTTMLWFLMSEGYDVIETISFNYGQRHVKELDSARQIVEKFNNQFNKEIDHQIVDLREVGKLISKGALTGKEDVPKEMYDRESQKVTVVPNRNGIMLNIAAGRAVTIGARYIAYAAHASDYSVYPDCRPEYIEAMDKAIYLGNLWDPVNILAPFKHLSKGEVTGVAMKVGAPLELTWSCYQGGERPCLECGTCLERTEAFLQIGESDPSLTDEEWKLAVEQYKKHAAKD
ncbi:MAG: 7-cyano-7-deazaguanine synthase QueC [Methanobacteriota archaeon]|nr:MAG: 7-cyano-7-deazaguanine synthase QueC [Euryarchaeota archaeon]